MADQAIDPLEPESGENEHGTVTALLERDELEVLRLVVAGKRNAEIAEKLVPSTHTVDHHVSSTLRKLGVRTRGQAAAAAIDGGFLDG